MSNCRLIPISDVHKTALGEALSAWTIYRLIRKGHLGCVRVGRRVFVTDELVSAFIRNGGAGSVDAR